jgi:hypothetical protein
MSRRDEGGYRYYGPGLEELVDSVQDPPTQYERALPAQVQVLLRFTRDGRRQAFGTFPRIVLHQQLGNSGLRTLMIEEEPGRLVLFRYIPENRIRLKPEDEIPPKPKRPRPPDPKKRPKREYVIPDRLRQLGEIGLSPGGIAGMPAEANELLTQFAHVSGILPPGTYQIRNEDDTLLNPGKIRINRPAHERSIPDMDRKAVIQHEIARLQEEMAVIDKYGKDTHEIGTVIRFQRRWSDGRPLNSGGILPNDDSADPWYTYAVLKADARSWYATGSQLGQMSWNDLVLWLVGAGDDIRNFQIATGWSEPMVVSPEDAPVDPPAIQNGGAAGTDATTESG